MCVIVPNFAPIGQNGARIWPFFDFLLADILDFKSSKF